VNFSIILWALAAAGLITTVIVHVRRQLYIT